jgi:glucose-1-phosphate adenylyltransferase
MRTNNVLGILFSNSYDEALPEFTGLRTMGSVPFGSRYRLIDFALSSMVNFGITKVGVVTKANYRSLMDHLGMGKAWDLSRKNEGLMLLPPFVGAGAGGNQTRMEGLRSALEFLGNSKEEYVIMGDCNLVCNLDYGQLMQTHLSSGADITVACKRGAAPKVHTMRIQLDENNRVTNLVRSRDCDQNALYSLNIFVLRKALLERLIHGCGDCSDFDLIARHINTLRVHGAQVTDYARVIDSLQSYYDISMELLDPAVQRALFDPARPVLTKIHDDMPAIYGLQSVAQNCLVADGCVIKGEVQNSVLFRGVVVEEGATVRNCVLFNGTYVSAGVTLDSVITDKSVVVKPGKTLMGATNYPIYLGKKIVV